eukprot:757851-Hanusia_phi.AAC.2
MHPHRALVARKRKSEPAGSEMRLVAGESSLLSMACACALCILVRSLGVAWLCLDGLQLKSAACQLRLPQHLPDVVVCKDIIHLSCTSLYSQEVRTRHKHRYLRLEELGSVSPTADVRRTSARAQRTPHSLR